MRATYGPGVPYYWRVTPFGRVYLYDAPFLTYDRYISHVPIHFVTEAQPKTQLCAVNTARLVRAIGAGPQKTAFSIVCMQTMHAHAAHTVERRLDSS